MLAPRTHLPTNHISLRALYDRDPDLPRRSFDRPVVVPYTKHRPNYFHWLFDGLGRLKILEDAGYSLRDFDYVFRELTPWQRASLQALGVPLDQCHVLGGYHCRIDELVVLSCPREGVSYSLDNVNWLRKRILGSCFENGSVTTGRSTSDAGLRVFIKRDAERRIFTDKDDFLPKLRDHGFRDVYLMRIRG
ncbi:glycosyltransferase family 61 protein [Salinibacter sp.]|uniref:glycosyltransferase family 61 protein n=1 Tax=Salinibacter sp. TaxID=2065818 RepID=UPI0021E6F2FE|nr:glycosyltransferase family 61 protein [Salinibacter sp.]